MTERIIDGIGWFLVGGNGIVAIACVLLGQFPDALWHIGLAVVLIALLIT